MKPAPFQYVHPENLDEALAAMARFGGDAKALAGGQSLVPAMNFRIAQPTVLVDLNDVSELAGITSSDESTGAAALRIGGMTRHRALERSAVVRHHAPLLAETVPFIAHAPIRTRGTLGGSLAHADPAAELPAVMLALDAHIHLRNHAGQRTIAAADFFQGLYATALAPDELVTEVVIPAREASEGWAFDEVSRRHGDFALAGVAAVVRLVAHGAIESARIALLGVHDRAVLAARAAAVLVGERPTPTLFETAAHAAADLDAEPSSDIHASSDYRRHLVRVLVRRVLARAVDRAVPSADAS